MITVLIIWLPSAFARNKADSCSLNADRSSCLKCNIDKICIANQRSLYTVQAASVLTVQPLEFLFLEQPSQMTEAERTTLLTTSSSVPIEGSYICLTSLYSFSVLNWRTKLQMSLFAFLISDMVLFFDCIISTNGLSCSSINFDTHENQINTA